MLERPKHLRVERVERSKSGEKRDGRERGRNVATLWHEERGNWKKASDFGETRRGRFPMFPIPRLRFTILLSSVSPFPPLSFPPPARLSFSLFLPRCLAFPFSLALLLIRRNFHRKFSRAGCACNTGGSGARRKCECSAVFISAPNEFAGRFAPARTRWIATRNEAMFGAGFGKWRENESSSSRLSRCGRKSVCMRQLAFRHLQRVGRRAGTTVSLFFSASRLRCAAS